MSKKCRGCNLTDFIDFLDLGDSPIANKLSKNISNEKFELKLITCLNCKFTQLSLDIDASVHFNENYPYFSGYSSNWKDHCLKISKIIENLTRNTVSPLVLEIASNDGSLLDEIRNRGIECMGIEPSKNVAEIAIDKGHSTLVEFFNSSLATKLVNDGVRPTIIFGSNVLAHVPDLSDFIEGLSLLMEDTCTAIFEFPHLAKMIEKNEFDTIYHEHYSYLALTSIAPIFTKWNLRIVDVDEISQHGGSLRIYIKKMKESSTQSARIQEIHELEAKFDPTSKIVRTRYNKEVQNICGALFQELKQLKEQGLKIAGFGAAAKAVTLLNTAGINNELIDYIIDSNPNKQFNYVPGTNIKIMPLENLNTNPVDVIIIFPWNISSEIISIVTQFTSYNPKFLVAIPQLKYLSKND
jgi:2-polyprenyl-3-methyl-5-hydroxy-6-metoxy-1,4-benzoquinol methylase